MAYANDQTVERYPDILWRRQEAETSAISSPYPNTNDITKLEAFLDLLVANVAPWVRREREGKFFVTQAILTPTLTQIINPLNGVYSLNTLANSYCNPAVEKWIETDWANQKPNIVMTDFVDQTDIVGEVIGRNLQR